MQQNNNGPALQEAKKGTLSDRPHPTVQHAGSAIASIVIPARNEAESILRCLKRITQDSKPGELEIVVVCNGCTDRTSEYARSFSPSVKVIETQTANKSYALNRGDAEVTAFPRFYIDADVAISSRSIRKVATVLNKKSILAASPRLEVDLREYPWPVRAYYRIWRRMPYYKSGVIGSGVYALSESGRKKFDKFPDLLAEDDYIRMRFPPSQREVVKDAWFRINPPRTFRSLIKNTIASPAGSIPIQAIFSQTLG